MKTICSLFLFAIGCFCTAQIHLNAGITDVYKRADGNNLSWSAGYSHVIGRVGARAVYRNSNLRSLSFESMDVQMVVRIEEKWQRVDARFGGSWNSVDRQIDPVLSAWMGFRVQKGIWVGGDIEHVFTDKKITHILFGVQMDVDWTRRKFRRKRFF